MDRLGSVLNLRSECRTQALSQITFPTSCHQEWRTWSQTHVYIHTHFDPSHEPCMSERFLALTTGYYRERADPYFKICCVLKLYVTYKEWACCVLGNRLFRNREGEPTAIQIWSSSQWSTMADESPRRQSSHSGNNQPCSGPLGDRMYRYSQRYSLGV